MKDKVRRSDSQNEYARNMKAYDELVALIEKTQEDRKKFEQDQQVKIDDAKAAYIATMVMVEKAHTVNKKSSTLRKRRWEGNRDDLRTGQVRPRPTGVSSPSTAN